MSKKSPLASAFAALTTAAALTSGCAIDPHMRELNMGPTVPAGNTVGQQICKPGEDANVIYGNRDGKNVASVTCTPRIRGAEPTFVLPARPFVVPADQIIFSTQKPTPTPAPALPRRVTPGGAFE